MQRNYVGTDITGTAAVPNGGGIQVKGGGVFAGTSIIGGVNAGNVIAGNSGFDAIVVTTTTAVIKGNFIGTRVDGVTPLPNLGAIQTYVNPYNAGSPLELPTTYQYFWIDRQGNILGTNDPSANPNSGSTGDWKQMQRHRP